jgi:thermitase
MIIRYCLFIFVFVACFLGEARAAERRLIVRTAGGSAAVNGACRLLGCTLVRSLGDPLQQLFTIALPANLLISNLLLQLRLNAITGLLGIEDDLVIPLLQPVVTRSTVPSGLWDRTPVVFDGTAVWRGYANQPAASIVRAQEARNLHGVQGAGPVAIIDSGIDPTHPVLRGVLLPGYDFTRDRVGASEMADLTQSTTAVVDGAPPRQVGSMYVAALQQSTTAVVDDPRYKGFGHGTMVAGIVHLVAPRAQILPLKAFGADGTGYLSDIIQAIYHATNANARVLNMSFSMPSSSTELRKAIEHAVGRQIICVSSAGNDGRKTTVFPASLDTVMGVGSTNLADRKSSFSNYGASLVWVAAPGEQIISTYPWGTYAAASGTSYSTPFVSGTAALLVSLRPSVDHGVASKAISNAKPLGSELGHGRLDAESAARSLKFSQ